MQRQLGYSNQFVTAIGLGAMPLSLEGRPDEDTAIRVIETFINNGGNFIDTANVYCRDDTEVGHNEKLINKALTQLDKKNEIIVATKGGLRRPRGRWDVDASPAWLIQSCEKSLHDLKVDAIYLYQLHAPDPAIPFSESIGALSRLREAGKIRHIGLSNVDVKQVDSALALVPVMSVQNRCNLFERNSFENGVVRKCLDAGITFIPHSPVGGHYNHATCNQSEKLKKIAKQYNASTYQVMLAWLLRQGEHILPIPGASKMHSIQDSMGALQLELSESDLHLLNTA